MNEPLDVTQLQTLDKDRLIALLIEMRVLIVQQAGRIQVLGSVKI